MLLNRKSIWLTTLQSLAVLPVLLTAAAHAQTTNLAVNGNFEGEGGWKDNWAWSGAQSTMKIVPNPAQAFEGRRALQVNASKPNVTQWNSNEFSLKEGKAYKVSFQYRGEGIQTLNANIRLAPPPWTTFFSTTVSPFLEWNQAEFIGLSPVSRNDVALVFSFEGVGTVWIDDVKITEIELPVGTPRHFDNLLQNSSFEVPPHYDDWILGNEVQANQWQLNDTTSVHGKYSLKFNRPLRSTYTTDFRSNSFPLQQNTEHTLSLYLKSDKPRKVTVSLRSGQANLFNQTFTVTSEWQRYSLSGSSKLGSEYFVHIVSDGAPLWLDGFYLSEGSTLREYKPMHGVEVAANIDTVAKTFVVGEKVQATISVANHTANTAKTPLSWYWLDWQGNLIGAPTTTEISGTNGRIMVDATPPKFGLIQLVAQPQNGAHAKAVFAYLPKPNTITPAQSKFGGHFHMREPEISSMKKMGIHWTRAHWPPVWTQWRAVEPKKGEWKFAEATMETAKREGVQILGSIATTPAWAAVKKQGLNQAYAMAYPDQMEDWRNYVRQVVTHYPNISAWEIFNEPHVSTFWSGSHEELINLYVEAAKIIKQINPQAKVIGWTVPSIKELHEHDALKYVDAMSEHPYGHGRTVDERVDEFTAYFGNLHHKLAEAGAPNIKIWNTEYGPGNWGSLRRPQDTRQHHRAIEHIIKHTVSQQAMGVEKFFPYLNSPSSGTGHNSIDEDHAPRTGQVAFAIVAHFTENTEPIGEVKLANPKLRAYRFKRGNEHILFLWTREPNATHNLGALPAGVKAYDEMGNQLSGPVTVQILPRIFVGSPSAIDSLVK